MKHEGQTIRNWILGIIGTVIAGLILAGLNYWIPSLWSFTKTSTSWVWSIATYTVVVPFWALCLIASFVVPTLIQLWNGIRGPTWHDYTMDEFDGIRWRWKYSGDKRVTDLCCYCPSDDTKLVYSEDGGEWQGWKFILGCETCRQRFGPFEGRVRDLEHAIERQIDRKIRNNEWKTDNDA